MSGPDGGAAKLLDAVLVDVSTSGVGLLVGCALDAGATFYLPLTAGGDAVLAAVVQCRPTRDGRYRVGARFVRKARGTRR